MRAASGQGTSGSDPPRSVASVPILGDVGVQSISRELVVLRDRNIARLLRSIAAAIDVPNSSTTIQILDPVEGFELLPTLLIASESVHLDAE